MVSLIKRGLLNRSRLKYLFATLIAVSSNKISWQVTKCRSLQNWKLSVFGWGVLMTQPVSNENVQQQDFVGKFPA